MRTYIECYYADGSQILGNLDGQAAIHAKNYKRTYAYKRILSIVGNFRHMSGKVAFAKIVDESGKVLDVIVTRAANDVSSETGQSCCGFTFDDAFYKFAVERYNDAAEWNKALKEVANA